MKSRALTASPQFNPGRGMKPEWATLPRRRCDNCGTSYKPKQPLRKNQKHGFCKRECKDQFHQHGAAFIQLRAVLDKEIENRLGPIRAELKELRALWSETESRYVALSARLDKARASR